MTLSFFYSFGSQITRYLGCLHSGVLAWISSPKKVSFSFVYVHSSYSQSSLAVTDGDSPEPALCYRMMLTQLQWHWQTPVSPEGWGQIHPSVLSVPGLPGPGELHLWKVTSV